MNDKSPNTDRSEEQWGEIMSPAPSPTPSLSQPETPEHSEVQNIRTNTREEIEEQLQALERYETEHWVEDDERKSKVLRTLVQRLENLPEKSIQPPPTSQMEGRKDLPEELEERQTEPEDVLKKARGNKALDEFTRSADKPYNLFHLDRNLSESELRERIGILDELYHIYKDAEQEERFYMEELIVRMFGVPTISKEAEEYLAHLDILDSTKKSEGAENKNLIFQRHENKSVMFPDHRGRPQVLKISKGRHDIDFTSVLKLMRNMHQMMLKFNRDAKTPDGNTIRIRLVADDITIYKDRETAYKRLIRQPFAPGIPIQQATRKFRGDQAFKDAWQTFLQEMEDMKETDGFVLDMTNSGAPFPLNRLRPRGNVADTENVFVQKSEDGTFEFYIIDPDVFDTREGEHKFDPDEHRALLTPFKAKLVDLMNRGRDTTTLGWQDHYSSKERQK